MDERKESGRGPSTLHPLQRLRFASSRDNIRIDKLPTKLDTLDVIVEFDSQRITSALLAGKLSALPCSHAAITATFLYGGLILPLALVGL